MTVVFDKVEMRDKAGARWLRWLDAECFPDDTPFEFPMTSWFIGWDNADGIAYCGWQPMLKANQSVGYLCRAGVLTTHRGRRLQRKMLTLRERDMRRQGIYVSVTYTSPGNAPSMRSLIGAGYRPFTTTAETDLAHGRAGFVHWKKEL